MRQSDTTKTARFLAALLAAAQIFCLPVQPAHALRPMGDAKGLEEALNSGLEEPIDPPVLARFDGGRNKFASAPTSFTWINRHLLAVHHGKQVRVMLVTLDPAQRTASPRMTPFHEFEYLERFTGPVHCAPVTVPESGQQDQDLIFMLRSSTLHKYRINLTWETGLPLITKSDPVVSRDLDIGYPVGVVYDDVSDRVVVLANKSKNTHVHTLDPRTFTLGASRETFDIYDTVDYPTAMAFDRERGRLWVIGDQIMGLHTIAGFNWDVLQKKYVFRFQAFVPSVPGLPDMSDNTILRLAVDPTTRHLLVTDPFHQMILVLDPRGEEDVGDYFRLVRTIRIPGNYPGGERTAAVDIAVAPAAWDRGQRWVLLRDPQKKEIVAIPPISELIPDDNPFLPFYEQVHRSELAPAGRTSLEGPQTLWVGPGPRGTALFAFDRPSSTVQRADLPRFAPGAAQIEPARWQTALSPELRSDPATPGWRLFETPSGRTVRFKDPWISREGGVTAALERGDPRAGTADRIRIRYADFEVTQPLKSVAPAARLDSTRNVWMTLFGDGYLAILETDETMRNPDLWIARVQLDANQKVSVVPVQQVPRGAIDPTAQPAAQPPVSGERFVGLVALGDGVYSYIWVSGRERLQKLFGLEEQEVRRIDALEVAAQLALGLLDWMPEIAAGGGPTYARALRNEPEIRGVLSQAGLNVDDFFRVLGPIPLMPTARERTLLEAIPEIAYELRARYNEDRSVDTEQILAALGPGVWTRHDLGFKLDDAVGLIDRMKQAVGLEETPVSRLIALTEAAVIANEILDKSGTEARPFWAIVASDPSIAGVLRARGFTTRAFLQLFGASTTLVATNGQRELLRAAPVALEWIRARASEGLSVDSAEVLGDVREDLWPAELAVPDADALAFIDRVKSAVGLAGLEEPAEVIRKLLGELPLGPDAPRPVLLGPEALNGVEGERPPLLPLLLEVELTPAQRAAILVYQPEQAVADALRQLGFAVATTRRELAEMALPFPQIEVFTSAGEFAQLEPVLPSTARPIMIEDREFRPMLQRLLGLLGYLPASPQALDLLAEQLLLYA